jgi:hypothetical protein
MTDPTILEFGELHTYIRHDLSVYVTWFTFFLTLLLGAMAWSLKASLNGRGVVVTPFPFFCMVTLFSVQLIFAVIATDSIAADFVRADNRSAELVKALNACADCTGRASAQMLSPFPKSLHVAIRLMEWTLVSNFLFWIAVAIYVYRKRGKRLMGGGE